MRGAVLRRAAPRGIAGRGPLQGLHQPVADHALGLRAEHIERIGMRQRRVTGAFHREHADLRAVAVGDDHVVLAQEGAERGRRAGDVRFLDVGVGRLAAFQERVAAQRGDHLHDRLPRVATMTALIVCIRFSAWSNTTEAGDSKTSSVTSSAVRPRRW